MSNSSSNPWWKTAVAYQIYPRSFSDTTGNGIGDLEGIRRHLDHLSWLGVDALWISPFYPSPMADFGYDVSDYCNVDPLFGTLDDFDQLLADAHDRHMKVIVDWVPNHTSDRHPWFIESRSSTTNPKRDWYYWRDAKPDGSPPNNWVSSFDFESAWTRDEHTGQLYLHCFLPEQPDLNWHNPEVVEAMHGTLRFWLDRGVDGFRMDVVHLIGKDPELADDDPELAGLSHVPLNNRPETHELLRGFRRLLDTYGGDRMAIGEVYLFDTTMVAEHYGDNDELHLNFNFPPLYTPWDAAKWRKQIARAQQDLDPIGAWPTWVLSNHDNARHRSRYGGSEARARAAAVLLLSLRGTPFLYAGEELGMEDAAVPADLIVDPGGRDGCRAPIPWTAANDHGWTGTAPWLPWAPAPEERNAEVLLADESSILHLYRRLVTNRKASPALQSGSLQLLELADDVVAFERVDESSGERRVVVVNFGPSDVALTGFDHFRVEVASDGRAKGQAFTGTVAGETGIILVPS